MTIRHTIFTLVFLAVALFANYRLATMILRLDRDPLFQLRTGMVPIRIPVVLDASSTYTILKAGETLRTIGIPLPQDLPQRHPLLLDASSSTLIPFGRS